VQSGSAMGGSTVVVNDLLKNTPAANSRLQNGDILLQLGDKKITRPEDVINASFYLTAGDDVPITVLRDGEKVMVNVQPIPDYPEVSSNPTPPSSGILLKMQQ